MNPKPFPATSFLIVPCGIADSLKKTTETWNGHSHRNAGSSFRAVKRLGDAPGSREDGPRSGREMKPGREARHDVALAIHHTFRGRPANRISSNRKHREELFVLGEQPAGGAARGRNTI